MFNLDEAITQWRQQLAQAGLADMAVLDELEAHLREDFAREVRSGGAPAAIFATVTARLGPPLALKVEFNKVNFAKRLLMGLIFVPLGINALWFLATECYEVMELFRDPNFVAYKPQLAWFPSWLEALLIYSWLILNIGTNPQRFGRGRTLVQILFSCFRAFLITVVGIIGLSCVVIAGLLPYAFYLRDGFEGCFEALPVSLAFLIVPVLIYKLSRKYLPLIRAGLFPSDPTQV